MKEIQNLSTSSLSLIEVNLLLGMSLRQEKKVALAFSGPRTHAGMAEWLAINNGARTLHPTNNPWDWFAYIDKQWQLQITKLSNIPQWVQNWFQERYFYGPTDGIHNITVTQNNAPRRWILKLSDWSTMLRQAWKTNETMYQNIDYDSNNVVITKPDWTNVSIEKVMSVESVWSGEIYLAWMWANANSNAFLSSRYRGWSKPASNVVVVTE